MSAIKILVVDDEPDLEPLMLQKFRRKIHTGEYDMQFARNGKEALEKIELDPEIALVMTDINMPVMDGLTLLSNIRQQQSIIRVIVVSAYGDLVNIRKAMNLGAFDFLTKPVDFSDLEATFNKTISDLQVLQKARKAEEKLGIVEEEKHVAIIERERAEQSKKFKEQFLANMSHEIRTPMNAVVGMTNLLLKTPLNEQQSKYLKAIKQSADNLLVIINDILDVSKIEAGRMEFEKIDFSLSDVLNGLYNTLLFKAEEKDLYLKTDYDSSLPDVLIGDQVRLNQILLNLAGNAIKFTQKGGVTLSTKLLSSDQDRVTVRFTVTDTGIGIAEDKVGRVFESFSQADSSTTRKFGGTGLGLTISKQLVELQGGTIGLTSQLGVGTEFFFTLTFPIGNPLHLEKIPEESSNAEYDDLRILLCEDNDFNQIVAKDTLESLFTNLVLEIAENGAEGVEKIKTGKYDLVLMDVNMPIMDGLTATREIRSTLPSPLNEIKIMAMTASATKEEVENCFTAGMDEYIAKPFIPEELKQKIQQLVKRESAPGKLATAPLKILVVDDNDFNQIVATDTLSELFPGAILDTAENGLSAIEKYMAGAHDIILMDLNMPVMGGMEATQQIRKMDDVYLSRVPIMAMTANNSAEEAQECQRAGMNDYITKPFIPDTLKKKILDLITQHKETQLK